MFNRCFVVLIILKTISCFHNINIHQKINKISYKNNYQITSKTYNQIETYHNTRSIKVFSAHDDMELGSGLLAIILLSYLIGYIYIIIEIRKKESELSCNFIRKESEIYCQFSTKESELRSTFSNKESELYSKFSNKEIELIDKERELRSELIDKERTLRSELIGKERELRSEFTDKQNELYQKELELGRKYDEKNKNLLCKELVLKNKFLEKELFLSNQFFEKGMELRDKFDKKEEGALYEKSDMNSIEVQNGTTTIRDTIDCQSNNNADYVGNNNTT